MKRTKLITVLAVIGLIFTGCGDSEGQATEPEVSEETEEVTSDQAPETQGPDQDQLAYLNALSSLNTTLGEAELLEADYNACGQIYVDQEDNDELGTVTGDNISHSGLSTMVQFDSDPDAANEIVRAAVYSFCPELIDQFDYEAMRSGPFFDDFEEERKALHEK